MSLADYRGPGIVLRPGELFLKRGNRRAFEDALVRNTKRAIAEREDVRFWREHGRYFLTGAADEDLLTRVKWVFGVASYSKVVFCERAIDEISRVAVELATTHAVGASTFRISARRSDKSFSHTSIELGQVVGHAVGEAIGLPVDLERADLKVGVEIGRGWTFLWVETVRGAGGLPVGTAGRAMLLLSGGIDSPVAGHMLQKRGLELSAVHFHAFPYTGDGSKEKAIDLARLLAGRQRKLRLSIVQFARVQELFRDGCPATYLVLLYRRAMIRIAERLAHQVGITALATGESLGQVASQTLANMATVEAAAGMTVLRPLVCFDKAETIELARRIGSYETSIRAHDDCCTLFVPRHPETKGSAGRAQRFESQVDWEPLVDEAVDSAEVIDL
ncbi:MAG: tRNA 4-thiouridine(8) synthase ThiI [Deltaproteobacteria bacterium]|nr:tRNA 4-thiouridine(8) synthase ThiI [Deltaproteobacteria bacterium]